MHDIKLEKKKFIDRCDVCGNCLWQCPLRSLSRNADKDSAKLQEARIEFLKGGEFSQEVYDLAFSCTECHYCDEVCEQGLAPSKIGRILRSELVNRGHSALPFHKFILPNERFTYFNIMAALLVHPSEIRWMTEMPDPPQHAEMVYFPGTGMYAAPHRMFTSLDILDRVGVDYVTLAGPAFSCGYIYLEAGKSAEAAEYGGQLLKSLSAFTPETVVTFDPGTTLQLKRLVDASSDISFRPVHFAAFLAENIDRLDFNNRIKRTITVHDPCHLGRGLGEFEGARKVLGAIPGITIVEMEHSGSNTLCCGQGASMIEPEAAKAIAIGLLDEAKDTGADTLVDFCPGCDGVFNKFGKDYPFDVVNFLTLVGRAMGIEHEDKLSTYMKWKDPDRVIEDTRANIEANSYSEQEIRSFLELLFAAM